MTLTTTAIRNARPKDKPYKLSDEKGLYLEVAPSGGRWWRFRYRFNGKHKTLSMGVFPDVDLKTARDRRDEARRLLANGVDLGEQRKAKKAAKADAAGNSFEVIAREWYAKYKLTWAPTHSEKILARLENDVFPWIGNRPIAEIVPPEILKVLRRIEGRGAVDTAHRVHQDIGRICRYAVATGRAERDPAADLRGALPPVKGNHFPALTDPIKIGALLRAFDGFSGSFVVQCALRLAPLLFVRPGELRTARWADIDLEKSEWKFVTSKTRTEHLVPLSRQAVAVLKELHALTGNREYVFPGMGKPNNPMSEAAINAALRRMGYDTKTEVTGHGWRATARTLLAEELHIKPEIIEHQLAHRVPDSLGTAYNRTKFLKERCAMMQLWADYLDRIKAVAEVIQLPQRV